MESKEWIWTAGVMVVIAVVFGVAAVPSERQAVQLPVYAKPQHGLMPVSDAAQRMRELDEAARAQEAALLRVYEQRDFEVMRGVVYEPGAE